MGSESDDHDEAGAGAGGADLRNHAIIAGYGVPGRAVADLLHARGVPFCVIELNPQTVTRCVAGGVHIIAGDAADEEVLRSAGIERATLFAATMPTDAAVLTAVAAARRLNPSVRIFARCRYVSTGIQASGRGADEVIVAEQIVAREFERLVDSDLNRRPATAGTAAEGD
jgi:voltage-gated potassium channel Kch